MGSKYTFRFLYTVTAAMILSSLLSAQWSTDPALNTPVCTATGNQVSPTIVSDGSGGAIITWFDIRNGDYDIYAQRIDASGTVQWTTNGVAICTATGIQQNPTIVSDGSGGAIITWYDMRNIANYDIYAQHINASGTVQWTADGVAICIGAGNQLSPTIVSDGSGGAIITWYDYRNGTDYDIYAQRINASGTVQWTANGAAICTATGSQQNPTIVSDGSSGAIITWYDYRNGNNDIFAQRINSGGTVQWAANGAAICTATGSQQNPTIVSDGSSGAIITWQDTRNGNNDIFAQRINSGGTVQWTADGTAICTATGSQQAPTIVSDGSGGAIITWYDTRNGNNDIFAQRINASCTVQWAADGTAICTATGSQQNPTIVSDGSSGAIITWQDARNGSNDIFAQRINASGTVQWSADGAAICTATGNQQYAAIVSDGSGGAVITWQDYRNGNNDLYTQRIYSNSALPVELTGFTASSESGKVILNWQTASEVNNYGFEIERKSENGNWSKIGFNEGAGSSNSLKSYSFTDQVKSGVYLYRLKQLDTDGSYKYSEEIKVKVVGPEGYSLAQNYPNPFNPATCIKYYIPNSGRVLIQIFDVLGNEIETLVDEYKEAGAYVKEFNAGNLMSGIYFYRITAGNFSKTEKMILMR